MVKKLEFLHFCRILDVFGHFNQYNHEKSTKIKVIIEICVVRFRRSTNTPGGNFFSEHHRGSNAKILSKKGRKFSFSQFSSIEICRIPIKTHSKQTSILYGWNGLSKCSSQLHLCTPRGVKFTYFDEKWHTIFCCLANYSQILTIKWCKAATLWHFQQRNRLSI